MKRIQRKRTKGWRMPSNAKYVGRGSRWGSQFRVVKMGNKWFVSSSETIYAGMPTFDTKREAAAQACKAYELLMRIFKDDCPRHFAPLIGKDLACWCPLGSPCHADVLLELLKETA